MICFHNIFALLSRGAIIITTEKENINKKKKTTTTTCVTTNFIQVGWHQDLYFWNLQPARVLTVWIALDDATIENGCMHFVPFPDNDAAATATTTSPHTTHGEHHDIFSEGFVKPITQDYHRDQLVFHEQNENPDNVLMAYQDIDPDRFGGLHMTRPMPLTAGECSLHSGYPHLEYFVPWGRGCISILTLALTLTVTLSLSLTPTLKP